MKKHCFMIIAHNQFDLLEKLIEILDDERNDIFIHVDKKASDFDRQHFMSLPEKSEITVLDERLSITWGDYSQVKCEMLLLQKAVSSKNDYEYYHLISGADLPIKSNDEIHTFFSENAGKEFVHFTDRENPALAENRLRYYHLFRSRRNTFTKIIAQLALRIQILFKVNRLKGKNIKAQKGCNWFSITGDFAKYIVKNIPEYEKIFRYSYCGDETFIQTVIENSPFRDNIYMPYCCDDHTACMRLIDWKRGNPYVWRSEDIDIIKSSPCMFARKFDMNVDSKIVDLITETTE